MSIRRGGGYGEHSLLLHHRDAVIHVPGDRQAPFLLGRRRNCDLVIQRDHISREHASIIRRDGCFVLVDQSLNGTYLQGPEGKEQRIHGGEAVLSGSGYLSLGRPLGESGEDLVYFYCKAPVS
ncbi:MAG: FHA domain-containing protein [Ectothiorhodospira sp.]